MTRVSTAPVSHCQPFSRSEMLGVAAAAVAGAIMRGWWLLTFGLTPDDALQAVLARQATFWEAIKAGFIVHHPPMIVALDHLIQGVWPSDVAIRIVPAVCGVAMPVVFYLWVRRWFGVAPAAITSALLLFSRPFFSLSVQSRGYAIAFALIAATLYWFDRALDGRSAISMVAAMCALWLSIVTDFSVAVFCVAAGLYAIWRMVERRAPLRLWAVWSAGQLVGIGIYVTLWFAQVQYLVRHKADETGADWLQSLFPSPGEGLVWFTFRGTINQFKFLMSSLPLAIVAAAAFAAGLALIWRRGPRPIALLIVTPFLLQWAASMAVLLPYGCSRHSAVLPLLASIAVAVSCSWLSSRNQRIAAAMVLALAPVWWARSATNPYDVEPERLRGMGDAAAFVRQNVPKGSILLATGEANAVIGFYLGADRWTAQPRTLNTVQHYGGYSVFSERLAFHNFTHWCGHLTDMISSHHLDPDVPVWVVDGGFFPSAASRIQADFGPEAIFNVHSFGYLVVYRIVPSRILPRSPACTNSAPTSVASRLAE